MKNNKAAKPKKQTEVRWRSESNPKALSTPQQEHEWKILRERQALNEGLSRDALYVPLWLERQTNQDWFEMYAENIIKAGEKLHEEERKLSAADQDQLSDEVSGSSSGDGCMAAIREVIEELEARGMSKAAIFVGMHNELNFLAEEILGKYNEPGHPNKPLFNATEEPVAAGAVSVAA